MPGIVILFLRHLSFAFLLLSCSPLFLARSVGDKSEGNGGCIGSGGGRVTQTGSFHPAGAWIGMQEELSQGHPPSAIGSSLFELLVQLLRWIEHRGGC